MPVEFQDITCPKPKEYVISRIRKDTKAKKDLKEALLYEQVDFDQDKSNKTTERGKHTPITRSRQRMNPLVQTPKNTNDIITTTIQQNVSNENEDQNIVTVSDNITFVASSKK